jgi:hypothetical protein
MFPGSAGMAGPVFTSVAAHLFPFGSAGPGNGQYAPDRYVMRAGKEYRLRWTENGLIDKENSLGS